MLITFQGNIKKMTSTTTLNVSPVTPISVSESKEGGVSICDTIHNNGGYRDIQSSLMTLLRDLKKAGLNMVKFTTPYGITYINIHPDIAFSINYSAGGSRLGYPTHNNGGYKISEPKSVVIKRINEAMS